MILGLYRLLTWLLSPVVWLVAHIQPKRTSAQWRNRLGTFDGPCDVWLHAASVGEISLLEPLIQLLHFKRSSLRVQITAMTEAGVKRGRELFGAHCTVSFAPYDFQRIVVSSLSQLQPKIIGIAETEIWPNLILGCADRNIPTILINGRMSERGRRGYQLARGAVQRLLSSHERLFIRSAEDVDRFRTFGVAAEKLFLAGDMKFDAPVQLLAPETRFLLRARLGVSPTDFLLVAGSTRPGEEEQLISVLQSLRHDFPNVRLLIAPRHLERIPDVSGIVVGGGFLVAEIALSASELIIDSESAEPNAVFLVTQMGLLKEFYQLADMAFVGGTLVPIGGHNLLEPVWAGTPVLFGPHISNVTDAAEYIVTHNFGLQIQNGEQLCNEIVTSIHHPARFARKTTEPAEDSAALLIAEYILRRIS